GRIAETEIDGNAARQRARVATDEDFAVRIARRQGDIERVEGRLRRQVCDQQLVVVVFPEPEELLALAELDWRPGGGERVRVQVVRLLPVEAVRFDLLEQHTRRQQQVVAHLPPE